MDSKEYMPIWRKKSILIGSPTNILAAITAFIPVLYLCIRYNCWPNPKFVLEAWGMLLISFGAFYVVEPVSYYAALGMSGTYLSFLSGNIGNMRVPCAALAQDVTKSEPGTIQAEVVSTMAICGSIITNLIATTAAAFVGAAVVTVLPAVVSKILCFRSYFRRNTRKFRNEEAEARADWPSNSHLLQGCRRTSGLAHYPLIGIRNGYFCQNFLCHG